MTVSRKPQRESEQESLELRREIQELFSRLSEFTQQPAALGEVTPAVDIYEVQGRFTVVVEVPGMDADALRVVYRDRTLTISGERRHRRRAGASGFLCLERPHGRFARSVPMEDALDLPRAAARITRGLLIIEIPRLKDRRGRETVIPVRGEPEE